MPPPQAYLYFGVRPAMTGELYEEDAGYEESQQEETPPGLPPADRRGWWGWRGINETGSNRILIC